MSVSGIGGYGQTSPVTGLSGMERYWSDEDEQSTSVYGSSKDKNGISGTGQLMSRLFQLSSTDQDAFKELAQQISDDLSAQASQASGTGKASMLSELSEKFAEAAGTGSMESLKPQGPPPPPSGSQGGDPMSQVEDIISQALSGVSGTSSGGQGGMEAIMARLKELQSSDPDAFKELAGQLAESLAGQAGSTTDSAASKLFSSMSEQFAEAAETGSMESLKPQGPPPPPPSQADSGQGQDGETSYASTPGSSEELYGLLQMMMGPGYSSQSSMTSLLAARSAYGVSL